MTSNIRIPKSEIYKTFMVATVWLTQKPLDQYIVTIALYFTRSQDCKNRIKTYDVIHLSLTHRQNASK